MKYYSYIDHLNITIDELINLSPYKLKEIIFEIDKTEPNRKTLIIKGLEDSVSRHYHITIEKNNWLKLLLFKKYDEIKNLKIELNLEYINYLNGFKLFLELYIRPIIPDLINQLINKNELKLLFNILNQSDLFSDSCKKDIIRLLKEKINYGTQNLHKREINIDDNDIKYIKNHLFYEILNLYKPEFELELIKLYDIIIDIEAQFETNSKETPLFRFIYHSKVAFQKSQIDDIATKLLIDNNAENAKEHIYDYSPEKNKSIGKYLSKHYQLLSVLTIIGLIIVIIGVSFNRTNIGKTEQLEHQTKEYNNKDRKLKKKQTTYDNRIQFYYSLKIITRRSKSNKDLIKKTEITPFSNPYPKTFNKINNDTIASQYKNVLIMNNTSSDLIAFKMIKGKDQSIYIPQNNTTYIGLKPDDSLLFYSGKNFLKSKFSHFNKSPAISEIYKVVRINKAQKSTITITAVNLENSMKNKTILKKNIETTDNIKLNKISIDNLYRNYYYKYLN